MLKTDVHHLWLSLMQSLPAYTALGEGGSIGFRQAIKNKWIQPGRDASGSVQVKKLVRSLWH